MYPQGGPSWSYMVVGFTTTYTISADHGITTEVVSSNQAQCVKSLYKLNINVRIPYNGIHPIVLGILSMSIVMLSRINVTPK